MKATIESCEPCVPAFEGPTVESAGIAALLPVAVRATKEGAARAIAKLIGPPLPQLRNFISGPLSLALKASRLPPLAKSAGCAASECDTASPLFRPNLDWRESVEKLLNLDTRD